MNKGTGMRWRIRKCAFHPRCAWNAERRKEVWFCKLFLAFWAFKYIDRCFISRTAAMLQRLLTLERSSYLFSLSRSTFVSHKCVLFVPWQFRSVGCIHVFLRMGNDGRYGSILELLEMQSVTCLLCELWLRTWWVQFRFGVDHFGSDQKVPNCDRCESLYGSKESTVAQITF